MINKLNKIKNLKELKTFLSKNINNLKNINIMDIPVFSDYEPNNMYGVWSYDKNSVLVQTDKDFKIILQKEFEDCEDNIKVV